MKKIITLAVLAATILTGCGEPTQSDKTAGDTKDTKASQQELHNKLSSAKEVKISKDIISLNNSYDIIIDGETEYYVNSEYFHLFEDSMTLTDKDGNVLYYEIQESRTLNLKFSRGATIYDGATDEALSYIGEEKINDLLNVKHKMHFYKNDIEIASTSTDLISFGSIGRGISINNLQGEEIYRVSGDFSIANNYHVEKVKDSELDWVNVIFLTTVTDAIYSS